MNKQVRVETLEIPEDVGQGGGFSVALVGSIPLVMPLGARLSADQVIALERAAQLLEIGAVRTERAATSICHHVERQLGVTQDLHQAGVVAAAAVLEAAIAAQKDARGKAAAERAAALLALQRPVGLTNAATISLDAAAIHHGRAAKAREAGDRRTAKDAATEAVRYERAAASAQRIVVDAVWLEGALAESVALRRGHGEDVLDIADELGLERTISVRDGLEVLRDTAAITQLMFMAGLSYRVILEQTPGRLGSQLGDRGSHNGGQWKHGVEWSRVRTAFHRAKNGVRLTRVEYEVARLGMREFKVLRWVAGCSGSINALGSSSGARAANTKALRRALDRAATVIWNLGLRIEGN